jgi:hypothetical protein
LKLFVENRRVRLAGKTNLLGNLIPAIRCDANHGFRFATPIGTGPRQWPDRFLSVENAFSTEAAAVFLAQNLS